MLINRLIISAHNNTWVNIHPIGHQGGLEKVHKIAGAKTNMSKSKKRFDLESQFPTMWR